MVHQGRGEAEQQTAGAGKPLGQGPAPVLLSVSFREATPGSFQPRNQWAAPRCCRRARARSRSVRPSKPLPPCFPLSVPEAHPASPAPFENIPREAASAFLAVAADEAFDLGKGEALCGSIALWDVRASLEEPN